ncbi:MAG: hypothetical protein ABEK29_01800, partial [Bradymonadaceae bacterium]
PPSRFVFTFAGSSIGCLRADKDGFVPENEGLLKNNLAPALKPLEPVADDVTLVSNLRIPYVEKEGQSPPPGGRGVQFHGVAQCPLLTGVRSNENDIKGDTADQVVAQKFGVDPLIVRAQADLYVPGNDIGGT